MDQVMIVDDATGAEVLRFWFEELNPKQWWSNDSAFDRQVKDRFLSVLEQAARGELFDWRRTPKGRLAEVIVIDQFSRNIHRNTPLAFAHDATALVLAQEAVAASAHETLTSVECSFLYMPFMHSESRAIHVQAEALFRHNGVQSNVDFELRHKAIVDRFGRYPHRNAILGRECTPEEIEFLKQPGSSF